MRPVAALAVLLLFSASAGGQNVFYEETFNAGIPGTWTQILLGYPEPWYWSNPGPTNGSADVWYESFCDNGFSFRNTILLSPAINLSGLTNATFFCEQYQLFPFARVYNGVKVTTNNGSSYTQIYQETGTWTGAGTIQVDLSAYAGQPNVRLAFHYQGAIANEWRIDNVRILTANPVYTLAGLAAGQTATLTVSGATPGSQVLIGVSFDGAGPIPTPYGNINMTEPIYVIADLIANGSGQATLIQPVPLGATGVIIYTQAGTVNPGGSVQISNSLIRTIQ